MVDTTDEAEYIPKSYQFERDLDVETLDERVDSIEFPEKANEHFVYHDMNELIDTEKGKKALTKMIRTFLNDQRERIKILEDYSGGKNHTILAGRRRIEKGKADYRVRHNLGGYISSFITGYIAGKPITVSYDGSEDDEDTNDLADVALIDEDNDTQTLNYDLAYDASRSGRAYELHYRSEDGKDMIELIDPKEIFVIREPTVSREIIGAVHCPIYQGQMYLTVYTDELAVKYEPTTEEVLELKETEEVRDTDGSEIEPRRKHFYNDVPVVEWWNNRYRIGDFENGLSIIDVYDAAQSDTANYMSDLNDAMLVVNVDDAESIGGQAGAQKMADSNVMIFPATQDADGKYSKGGDAKYIYKQYDVQGAEAYKDRLLDDLFKLSNVPNLEDERFGTQSGIAIEYKLIGLKQVQVTKESYFKKALRRRYELIENIHKELDLEPIDGSKLDFTFHPNLPQDVWAEVKAFIESGGQLSQETLRELASFTDNKQELQRLLEENIRPDASDAERDFWTRGVLDEPDAGREE